MSIVGTSIKPGDLIEWIYEGSYKLVSHDEKLWSTLLQRYVPIGSELVHILIAVDNDRLVWLNSKGLFHANIADARTNVRTNAARWVVPRSRGSADRTNIDRRSGC
jgi:hypothetical protein